MADDGPPEDLTKEDLWNRLRRLEQHVFPSRRQMLKAGGAAALFGAGAVGGASAAPGDDGDTVWGSDTNRDDYYADEVDANLVSTDATVSGGFATDARNSVTISSGAISITDSQTYLEVKGENANSDDLTTISGGTANQIIVLRKDGVSGTITVKHSSDNIFLDGSADKTLSNNGDRLTLLSNFDGTSWIQIAYSAL